MFGFAAGGALGAIWIYLKWVNPKAIYGLAPLFGVVIGCIGLLCVAVAVLSIIRSKLPDRTATARLSGVWRIEDVHALNWQEFERLIADLYRREGFEVEECGRDAASAGTGDGGVDLVLRDPKAPGAAFLVQCKQYLAWQVGEPAVREFYGAMAAWGTRCEGIFITCGRFTEPAKAFAEGKPLRLIDGDDLLKMLNRHNAVIPDVRIAAPASALPPGAEPMGARSPQASVASLVGVPACPRCGAAMVRRGAGRGARRGMPFWGCANYPGCDGIVNIAR